MIGEGKIECGRRRRMGLIAAVIALALTAGLVPASEARYRTHVLERTAFTLKPTGKRVRVAVFALGGPSRPQGQQLALRLSIRKRDGFRELDRTRINAWWTPQCPRGDVEPAFDDEPCEISLSAGQVRRRAGDGYVKVGDCYGQELAWSLAKRSIEAIGPILVC